MLPRGNSAIGDWLFVISYHMMPSTDSTIGYSAILATGTYLQFENHWSPPKFPRHPSPYKGWVAVGLDWPQHSSPRKYVWVYTQCDKLLLMFRVREKILGLSLYAPFLSHLPIFLFAVFLFLNFSFVTLLLFFPPLLVSLSSLWKNFRANTGQALS